MKKALLTSALLGFMTLSGAAHADYITLDWQEEGDSRAFLSEETGIEWLKLDETTGYSVSSIPSEFGEGGEFEGWRLATRAEVNALMDDIIDYELNEGTTYANWSSTDVPGIYEEFMSLFGLTHESGNSTYSYGYYANDFATTGLDGDVLMTGVNSTNGTRLYEDYEHASYSYTNTSSIVGVFLTADGGATLSTQQDPTLVSNNANAMANQVPVFTFGAGLLALGLIGFRKKGNGDA
jgi:hypothetical protein